VTDTTTDQTMTGVPTDPATTRERSGRTDAPDGASIPATNSTGTRSGAASAQRERTADEIVAERTATRDAGPDAETKPLSTADIASGRRGPATGTTRTDADGAAGRDVDGERVAPLFDEAATADLRDRWTDVQAGFVDAPRSSVEAADGLVAEVMKRLADSFATEREALEQQWSRGDDASTEDLRVALRRYRSFFDRLLSF
jgi:hypothetical protein